ncbi:MAG: class I SAM-dependent methyltransferase [Defluviitaleaceae bacterium]|nr:class I SAM-dependent methyltransferase [Defluviitaleaceae bacterium]
MDFDTLRAIKDESERISALYKIFNEDTRLNYSKSAKVEFFTTVSYVEKYLKHGSRIIDVGAGAGEYSIYFAKQGYTVTAVELVENNVRTFKEKLTSDLDIDLRQGNACDLSDFDDCSFDVVLLLGPLYHISNPDERKKCIDEARRVCKKDGVIFFAYISNDMVILTETFLYNLDYLKSGDYDKETFVVDNFPFVFFTVSKARNEIIQNEIILLHEIAVDGVSELLAEKINQLDDDSFNQYLKYHFYCCEKPEMLGMSNHLLFVGHK